MTTMRGVGHLRLTVLGLALFVWPAILTCAGDAPAGAADDIAVSFEAFERSRLDSRPIIGATRTWNRENASRGSNSFLDGHLLPQLRGRVKGLRRLERVPEEQRLDVLRRDVERATTRATKDYLEDIAIDPMRERLDEWFDEKVRWRLGRLGGAKRPEPNVDPRPAGPEPARTDVAFGSARVRRNRGEVDLDVGFSGGLPRLNLEYKKGRLDLDFELGADGPELQLKLGSGKRQLRIDIDGNGEMGLLFRPARLRGRSTIRATLDAMSGECAATYVHKF